ncbi:MAG: hypothetical protein ACK5NF_05070 [Bacilli bacterium]
MKKILIIVFSFFIMLTIVYIVIKQFDGRKSYLNTSYTNYLLSNGYSDNDGTIEKNFDKYFNNIRIEESRLVNYDLFVIIANMYGDPNSNKDKLGITAVYIPKKELAENGYSLTMYLDEPTKIYINDSEFMGCVIENDIIEDTDCIELANHLKDELYFNDTLELLKQEYSVVKKFDE